MNRSDLYGTGSSGARHRRRGASKLKSNDVMLVSAAANTAVTSARAVRPRSDEKHGRRAFHLRSCCLGFSAYRHHRHRSPAHGQRPAAGLVRRPPHTYYGGGPAGRVKSPIGAHTLSGRRPERQQVRTRAHTLKFRTYTAVYDNNINNIISRARICH